MKRVPRLTEEDLDSFEPLNDWVVIRKYKEPDVTDAGIIVPEDRKDYQSKRGTVVKIGPCENLKAKNIQVPRVTIGDEVLFSAFAGMEVPMPDGYLIMKVSDIMVVLED